MATVVLKNLNGRLDLTIRDREFVVLAGPSNEGSKIIRTVAGLIEPSEGEILFDGKPIRRIPPGDRDVALLSHDYAPYPRLSVYENLEIGLRQRRFGEAEIKKRIAAVVEALGIQDHLNLPADSLAPAQRQFIGLARAMARQPRVFLFDRPFANLGAEEASRGRGSIAELQQRAPTTIIYATTDPMEALAFSARTVVIADGVIQQDAPAQAVYDAPANLAVARFFGNPPMNLVQGTLKADRDVITFGEAGEGTITLTLALPRFDVALAGKQVVLGFRPESVEVVSSPDGSNRPGQGFRALVERVEPNGAQTDLYLRTGAHELVCRTGLWESQGGRRLQFAIHPAKTHLFAGANGLRLNP